MQIFNHHLNENCKNVVGNKTRREHQTKSQWQDSIICTNAPQSAYAFQHNQSKTDQKIQHNPTIYQTPTLK